MTVFGDYEPEDAWDAEDPAPVELHNLIERLVLLEDHLGRDTPLDEAAPDVLDRIRQRVRHYAVLREATDRDLDRIADILEDIAVIEAKS